MYIWDNPVYEQANSVSVFSYFIVDQQLCQMTTYQRRKETLSGQGRHVDWQGAVQNLYEEQVQLLKWLQIHPLAVGKLQI